MTLYCLNSTNVEIIYWFLSFFCKLTHYSKAVVPKAISYLIVSFKNYKTEMGKYLGYVAGEDLSSAFLLMPLKFYEFFANGLRQ